MQSSVGPSQVEQDIAHVVARAFHAFAAQDRVRLELAATELVTRPDVEGWRAAVLRELGSRLDEAVAGAWERGWQPGDVARMVARRLGRQHHSLAAGAIAAQMAGYAAATVDPRWRAQLEEVGAGVWWPAEQTHLQACVRGPGDWVLVVPAALELLCLLTWLPRIEVLLPLPGEYRAVAGGGSGSGGPGGAGAGSWPGAGAGAGSGPGAGAGGGPGAGGASAGGARPHVDERVLSRIRALLAKAEATTSSAEAEAFTEGAQERMARYSIDAAMLAASGGEGSADRPGARRIGVENPYESAKALLLDAVARANRCRSVWTRRLGFCTVIGHETDLDAVETLFTSLLVQATTAVGQAAGGVGDRSRSRAFRSSFLAAYAHRIGERLAEVTSEVTSQESAAAGAAGRNVLPVLASREAAVEEAVRDVFPGLRTARARPVADAGGWFSGQAAADRATLTAGRPLRP